MAERTMVGTVTHCFGHIGVAVVSLKGALKIGDAIEIENHDGTKVVQKVASMQVNHENVDSCKTGDDVGLKVDGKVHEGATVYKVS